VARWALILYHKSVGTIGTRLDFHTVHSPDSRPGFLGGGNTGNTGNTGGGVARLQSNWRGRGRTGALPLFCIRL
jgi:hypothetical protein